MNQLLTLLYICSENVNHGKVKAEYICFGDMLMMVGCKKSGEQVVNSGGGDVEHEYVDMGLPSGTYERNL